MTQKETNEIKQAIRERDGWKCRRCGMTNAAHKRKHHGRSLHIHRPRRCEPYSLKNGKTMCAGCHGLIWKVYNGILASEREGYDQLLVEIPVELSSLIRMRSRDPHNRGIGNFVRTLLAQLVK